MDAWPLSVTLGMEELRDPPPLAILLAALPKLLAFELATEATELSLLPATEAPEEIAVALLLRRDAAVDAAAVLMEMGADATGTDVGFEEIEAGPGGAVVDWARESVTRRESVKMDVSRNGMVAACMKYADDCR